MSCSSPTISMCTWRRPYRLRKEQCGPVAPRVGNSGTGHDKLSDCALAKRLYWGLCAETGTNTQPCFTSEDEVCKNAREPSWNFSRLTRAGVWADVRDLDVASAESHLYDAMTKAELETEVLGLKLGRVDALSWLWLAILSAEVYAACLILLAKPTPEEKEDWWSRLPCQLFVGAATIVGIGVSVASHPDASAAQKEIGKPTVFGYSVPLSIALFLAIAVLTITAATRLRHNRASGHHRRQS